MTDMIRKLIPVEVKEVADRTLEMAGSTEDKDRMGDIIRASGWKLKNFKKNPVFMWAHRYDDPPIGRANKVWVDKETNRLMFNVEFAPPETYDFADTIYKLYKGGFLHATSVGFMPLDWEGKDDDEHSRPNWESNVFTSQDLLELSGVPVPANPNALVSARDQGIITVKEFEAVGNLVALSADNVEVLRATLPETVTITKPEEMEADAEIVTKPFPNEHACRLKDPDQYDTCRRGKRTATEPDSAKGKEYSVIFCKKTDGPMEEQAYRYDKEDWTAGQARSHCNAHDGAFEAASNESAEFEPPEPKAISQEQLGDELDFALQAIREVGLNDKQMPAALDLANEIIMRCSGNDIPVDILSKVGAVLDDTNKERLNQIRQLAQDVFNSTPTEEGEKQETPPELDPVKQRARDVAEVADLVLAKLRGKRIY